MTAIGPIETQACSCDSEVLLDGLISLEEAVRRVMTLALPVDDVEILPLARSVGRVLAQPVSTATALPPFDNSAMDGYAIRLDDLSGSSPWSLRQAGRVAAGSEGAPMLAPGCAVRVLTGACLPEGTDAVVMQEAVKISGDNVIFDARPKCGANIRYAGSELATGTEVLWPGQVMGARQIGLAAAAGVHCIKLHRKLRIVVLISGNELRSAGATVKEVQVSDANGPMLQAELTRPDVMLIETVRVSDDIHDLSKRIAWASESADLVITTGGASVGDADYLASALILLGARTIFHGVAIKPGKSVLLAEFGGTPLIGLPGNPVAAFVTWALLGRPLLNGLSGRNQRPPQRRLAVAARDFFHKPGRCEFRPARIIEVYETAREVVDADVATHSARLSILERSDGLAVILAETELVRKGDLLEFFPF